MPYVRLSDFMTTRDIRAAVRLWNTDRANFHRRVRDEIVCPAMAEINRKTGQENDPDFVAYSIEYVFTEAKNAEDR